MLQDSITTMTQLPFSPHNLLLLHYKPLLIFNALHFQVVLGWYDGKEKVDLSDYVNSGTWDVISVPGVNNNTWDETEGHHKSHITYTLKIRRKTLFYTVNLIIPCVLISFLSVSVFLLPADAHEKVSFNLKNVKYVRLIFNVMDPLPVMLAVEANEGS